MDPSRNPEGDLPQMGRGLRPELLVTLLGRRCLLGLSQSGVDLGKLEMGSNVSLVQSKELFEKGLGSPVLAPLEDEKCGLGSPMDPSRNPEGDLPQMGRGLRPELLVTLLGRRCLLGLYLA